MNESRETMNPGVSYAEWKVRFQDSLFRKQKYIVTAFIFIGTLLILPDALFDPDYPLSLVYLRLFVSAIALIALGFYWYRKVSNSLMIQLHALPMFVLMAYIIAIQPEVHMIVQQQTSLIVLAVMYMILFRLPLLQWLFLSFVTTASYFLFIFWFGDFPLLQYLSTGGFFLLGGLVGLPFVSGFNYRLASENYQLHWELERQRDELAFYANKDILTGVVNRRGGLLLLEKQISLSRRYQQALTLCFIDLDGLKQVNDNWGHKMGDDMILTISRLIRENIRATDFLVRYAGDEFLCLFPQTELVETRKVMQKIEGILDEMNRTEQKPYPLAFSYGSLEYDLESNPDMDDFISKADALMYEHKRDRKLKRTARRPLAK